MNSSYQVTKLHVSLTWMLTNPEKQVIGMSVRHKRGMHGSSWEGSGTGHRS